MMKTKFNLSTLLSKICVALMAFLGYGCEESGECMYGTPTGTWEIKGTVTDAENESATPATIKITHPNVESSVWPFIVTQTDDDGQYSAKQTGTSFSELKVVCIPDDSSLKADSTVVKLTYHDKNKKDEWDVGNAEATVNFSLKKKEN